MSETPAPYKVEAPPIVSYWLLPRDEDGVILSAILMAPKTDVPTPADTLLAARVYLQHDPQAVWVDIFDNAHDRPALRRLRAFAWKPCPPHGATEIQTHITQEELGLR